LSCSISISPSRKLRNMPIEIRELNIKVSVSQNQQEQGNTPPAGKTGGDLPDKDEIISECVEQVMELLQLKNER
jgi:hypothetical protein